MEKIVRVSLYLKGLFSVLLVITPVFLALYWAFFNELLAMNSAGVLKGVAVENLPIQTPVGVWIRFLGFMASFPGLAVDLYALFKLRQLFSLYIQGSFFVRENVQCIKALGYTLIIGEMLNPAIQALLTLVLTLSNPPGQRMVQIGLSNANLTALVSGIMIIVAAWIMDEGRKLQEEQSLTI